MLATGRAGDPPIGVSNSWADFMAGLHAAVIITAALERRGRAGEGCWIDVSQYESNALPLGSLMARICALTRALSTPEMVRCVIIRG